MIRYFFILTFLFPALYTFAQGDAATIKAARIASNEAIARHDIDGVSKYWLPDFVQTIGRGTSLTGKDTIIASWKALFKGNETVSYERKPTSIEVGDNGIMAWETGIWTAKNSYSKEGIIQRCGEKSMVYGNYRRSYLCHLSNN
ncbi:MAG TPA: nuclear transport factor 2 family protein [Mucilaginibacter sp.]|jgi:ketosteroid isomerase-like protein